jgi:uncharacterized surface protein with fasciclin (FAS1) repeats
MYACKDEFILDDEKPSWLNSSIYESLEQKGNFRTYLKLLADKDVNLEGMRDLVDVLSRTGSKTVFVAKDSAWDAFFAANALLPESNPWHYATSYDKLSKSQKKLLIHTSMLNNAIVMENLASSQSEGTNSPTRGEYMRRYTDVEATDSITKLESKDLPRSYSYYYLGGTDKDYWERFREEKGGKGIYLAIDSTLPMMLHFTSEHMSRNTINDNDFLHFMGKPRNPSDVHIYNSILKEKDGVCENGYVNVTEMPLCPLTNMAEVIRTNGKTDVFSHILDRFSAPFYCNRITKAYQDLHPEFKDSIFTKRYFSDNNFDVKAGYIRRGQDGEVPKYEPGPNGTFQRYNPYKDNANPDRIPALKFDPGWNGYYDEVDVRKDMAAMFVPSDEQMWQYFTKGSGQRLLKVYYAKEGTPDAIDWVPPTEGDNEALFQQIDCIPVGTLDKLINNFMQRSFVGSVPSKWGKLTDDAMEPLFEDVDVARDQDLDTCLLASNGVVYVLNRTCVPADYRSVTAPAFISNVSKIIKSAIYDDYMNLNYYAYLKAMQSRFTFLLPTDEALTYYYDPASMKSRTPRAVKFSFQGGSFPVKLQFFNYYCSYNQDKGEIGTIGNLIPGTSLYTNGEVTNRLKDILESHTIVHDGTNPMAHTGGGNNKLPTQEYYGINPTDPLPEYYLSKNGNAVKVIRDENDKIIAVKGGFQLENEREGIVSTTPGVLNCVVTEPNETDNGYTFVLNAPLVPTYRSVYSIFTNDYDLYKESAGETPYSAFYDLCTADGFDTEIIGCGLVDGSLGKTQRESALKKYYIFIKDNGLDYNVQFFNNYRYTVFVPTNDAVQAAIAAGLPTWEDISEDYHSHCKPLIDDETGEPRLTPDGEIEYTDELQTYEDSVRIAAKITYLTNFVRYHFADNSVFADKTVLAPNEMVTSSYDKELELFCKLHVDRVANGDGTDLRVCDDVTWKKNNNSMTGGTMPFVTIGEKNVLARDISCSSTPVNVAMKGITINSSSAAVIHSIPGYLNHTEVIDGRHDKTWESTIKAKKYLQRYAIR